MVQISVREITSTLGSLENPSAQVGAVYGRGICDRSQDKSCFFFWCYTPGI